MRLPRLLPVVALVYLAPSRDVRRDPAPSERSCSATGDLEIRDFHSAIFHNSRKLRVLLPAGYRDAGNADRRYPVLYLNDGQNLFDTCTNIWGPKEWRVDETTIRLIQERKVEPVIIVGVDNAGEHSAARSKEESTVGSRPNEYLPWPDAYLSPPLPHVHGTEYPAFLTTEVMPFIQHTYRVKTGPESTGLGGSSYGALISFYTALHRPGVFGRLLIESPSLYVHEFAVLEEAAHQKSWPARIYFGAGTEETPGNPPDQTVPAFVERAVAVLKGDGVTARRVLVNITGGKHNEDAWANRFPVAISFLFPANPGLATQ